MSLQLRNQTFRPATHIKLRWQNEKKNVFPRKDWNATPPIQNYFQTIETVNVLNSQQFNDPFEEKTQ